MFEKIRFVLNSSNFLAWSRHCFEAADRKNYSAATYSAKKAIKYGTRAAVLSRALKMDSSQIRTAVIKLKEAVRIAESHDLFARVASLEQEIRLAPKESRAYMAQRVVDMYSEAVNYLSDTDSLRNRYAAELYVPTDLKITVEKYLAGQITEKEARKLLLKSKGEARRRFRTLKF